MGKRVVIIGAGELGRALAKVLSTTKPLLWNRSPKKGAVTTPLTDFIPKADIITLAIPTAAHREFLEKITPLTNGTAIILSPAKGIEETGKLVPEIIAEITEHKFGLLLGPMIAEEMMKGMTSYALCVTSSPAVYARVFGLFESTTLKVQQSVDLVGASVLSVVKNVYAVALGVCDALKVGSNTRGLFITQAVQEMERLVECVGGKRETVISIAGTGDLFATATSKDSTNYETGIQIVKKGQIGTYGEGLASLPGLKNRLGASFEKFPLLKLVDDIVSHPRQTKKYVQELL